MTRSRALLAPLAAAVALALLAAPSPALAQAKKPVRKGAKLNIKVDSVPQQAAIYIDDKAYGVEGYTPAMVKLPKGSYKFILEAAGFKPFEKILIVDRAQAFVFTLERQARPAVLDVRAGTDGSASGGSITVDGAQVGVVPNRIEVGAGSHLIEINRPGYVTYRDNLQVGEGETRTVVVVLSVAQRPGSILVTADQPGADVYVDGQKHDPAPTVVEGVSEGAHTVEVRKDPMPPFKQVVMVVAGQRAAVAATFTPPSGSLKVLSGTAGAEVFVDGDDKGPAGTEIKDVRAGTHIIEVRAKGSDPKRQEIEIKANEMRVIEMDLAQSVAQKSVGSLRVISPVPGAEAFVDGASVGKVPVEKNDLSAGHHFVVVHADGYADYKTEVDVEGGKSLEVTADLRAAGSVRVLANVPGAEVYIDGSKAGVTPATLPDVAVGDHLIELKSPGYIDERRTLTIVGGKQEIVTVDLRPMLTGPTPADLVRQQREQSSFGATVIDRFKFNVDLGLGIPYLTEYYGMVRVITGILHQGGFGLDVGIELRSNILYATEVGLRPRVQILRYDPVAVGFDLTVLGGGGATHRNTFTFEIGPIVTLLAGSYVRITFHPYLGVWSDRVCPSVGDIQSDDAQNGMMMGGNPKPGSGPNYQNDEATACKVFDTKRDSTKMGSTYELNPMTAASAKGGLPPSNFGQPDPRERFNTTRLMLQGVVEIAVLQNVNLWLIVEGAPFQDQRQSLTSKFSSWYPDQDYPLYVRLGASIKF